MKAVFRLETFRIFSGRLPTSSCRKEQKFAGKSSKFFRREYCFHVPLIFGVFMREPASTLRPGHAIHAFYSTMSIDEICCRCLIKLCSHEQYYDAIRMSNGLEQVDDECVQDHVVRILNNNQYTGILTLAAVANVLNRPITLVYRKVNNVDEYFNVLNTTFFPREKQNSELQAPIHNVIRT